VVKRCRSCSKVKVYAPSFDPAYIRSYQRSKRQQLKVRAIEHSGGRCLDCGLPYDGKNGYAFDFHHLDSKTKDYSISAKNRSWEKLLVELAKCVLLCGLCHRRRHSDEY
jgi:hypothetical protein